MIWTAVVMLATWTGAMALLFAAILVSRTKHRHQWENEGILATGGIVDVCQGCGIVRVIQISAEGKGRAVYYSGDEWAKVEKRLVAMRGAEDESKAEAVRDDDRRSKQGPIGARGVAGALPSRSRTAGERKRTTIQG